jgi:hypothetical protein
MDILNFFSTATVISIALMKSISNSFTKSVSGVISYTSNLEKNLRPHLSIAFNNIPDIQPAINDSIILFITPHRPILDDRIFPIHYIYKSNHKCFVCQKICYHLLR